MNHQDPTAWQLMRREKAKGISYGTQFKHLSKLLLIFPAVFVIGQITENVQKMFGGQLAFLAIVGMTFWFFWKLVKDMEKTEPKVKTYRNELVEGERVIVDEKGNVVV